VKVLKLLVGFALGALASFAAVAEDPEAAEFRAREIAWSEAIRAQDRDRLESFLSPDYTLTVALPTGLSVTEREEWLRNAVTVYKIEEFEFTELAVRRFGDVAIVSSRYRQKATVNGRDRSGEAFLTDVWVRSKGKWRVSARYSSRAKGA
jgi:ketosteroid isomerase-like protein